MPAEVHLLVIAKAPVPGRVKTRLSPPYSPEQAAALAAAALDDTLDAVRSTPAAGRTLLLAGDTALVDAAGFDVVEQRGGGLDERLAHGFDDAAGLLPGVPLLLVGMDTPQVTPELLLDAAERLASPGTDAVLGLARDGGWWALGLRRPDDRTLLGVPMSRSDTGALQRQRLEECGLRVGDLEVLDDVDTEDDVRRVAAAAPGTRFAALAGRLVPDAVSAR